MKRYATRYPGASLAIAKGSGKTARCSVCPLADCTGITTKGRLRRPLTFRPEQSFRHTAEEMEADNPFTTSAGYLSMKGCLNPESKNFYVPFLRQKSDRNTWKPKRDCVRQWNRGHRHESRKGRRTRGCSLLWSGLNGLSPVPEFTQVFVDRIASVKKRYYRIFSAAEFS